MRACLVLLVLCAPAFARPKKHVAKKPPPAAAGCAKSWGEAKKKKFDGCKWPDAARLFAADNPDGDTPFKAVASVCYARGGDERMAKCLPAGDDCPPSGKDACLATRFQCCYGN
jgi:hypothetical protein